MEPNDVTCSQPGRGVTGPGEKSPDPMTHLIGCGLVILSDRLARVMTTMDWTSWFTTPNRIYVCTLYSRG